LLLSKNQELLRFLRLAGLTLPSSIRNFLCNDNKISIVDVNTFLPDGFPKSLTVLGIDKKVILMNPKFNSILTFSLRNKIQLDLDNPNESIVRDQTTDQLIFLYLNYSLGYQTHNQILDELHNRNFTKE
jgi:hypothetical protein